MWVARAFARVKAAVRRSGRQLLEHFPAVEARFRRHIWSRLTFPEAEMRVLAELRGRPFDVSIDVGAALGGYAWLLGRASRRVIAFEPGQVHADFLERGVAATNIEIVRAAVGPEAGKVQMFTPGHSTDARHSATLSPDNPIIHAAEVAITTVPQVALDDFVHEHLAAHEHVDFLKIDVEGYEFEVCFGARALIARDHPIILCEIEARHNAEYRKVFELLREMGYAGYVRRGGTI